MHARPGTAAAQLISDKAHVLSEAVDVATQGSSSRGSGSSVNAPESDADHSIEHGGRKGALSVGIGRW